jgi:hypothetical protein
MIDILARVAEQRILEALEKGEFEKLEGAGKPFVFEDETFVPEDLRAAYRVLKNAGCIPPELEIRKEIVTLKDLINTIDDDKERLKKIRELNFKLIKFEMVRGKPLRLEDYPDYQNRIEQKMIE